jgi:hypothetical protein
MALTYLLDENERGLLWRAVQRHNILGVDLLDVVRVGDFSDLPLRSVDPVILLWCEAHDRILVSRDKKTLASHLAAHLAAGRHSPGIFLSRQHASIHVIVDFLAEAAQSSLPVERHDRIEYIP